MELDSAVAEWLEERAMPNPKHKHSRARRDKRRTQKLRITPPGMAVCPQCHELKLPHYTCLNCGTYKGKAVIQVEEV
ncbi:50S ribosomal protein L32 [Nitrospira sp. KM1]|nr:50S ribosomal protein L32 [Nitrospira sp. KM1]